MSLKIHLKMPAELLWDFSAETYFHRKNCSALVYRAFVLAINEHWPLSKGMRKPKIVRIWNLI